VDEDEDGRSVACNHLASMTPAPGASCRLPDLARPAPADSRAGEAEERDVDVYRSQRGDRAR
jgi:hypothetical protein